MSEVIIKKELLDDNPIHWEKYYIKQSGDYVELLKSKEFEWVKFIWIIGPYWSGKSSLIECISNNEAMSEYEYFVFDAWATADREKLWDSFVYTFIKNIIWQDQILKYLSVKWATLLFLGGRPEWLKELIKVFLWWLAIASLILLVQNNSRWANILAFTVASLGLWEILLRYNLVKNQNPYFYREYLDTLLSKFEQKKIIIQLEDIDRCNREGVVFLETLIAYFRDKKHLNIKFLIPIARQRFIDDQLYNYRIKCLDIFKYFNVQNTLSSYFRDLFIWLEENEHKSLEHYFWFLVNQEYYSIREIKKFISEIIISRDNNTSKENLKISIYIMIHFAKYWRGYDKKNHRIIHPLIPIHEEHNRFQIMKTQKIDQQENRNERWIQDKERLYWLHLTTLWKSLSMIYSGSGIPPDRVTQVRVCPANDSFTDWKWRNQNSILVLSIDKNYFQ